MHAATDTDNYTPPFDPDAYLRVHDFAAALANSSERDIDTHEKRPRPAGAASAAHHVTDVVFRARRLATDGLHGEFNVQQPL